MLGFFLWGFGENLIFVFVKFFIVQGLRGSFVVVVFGVVGESLSVGNQIKDFVSKRKEVSRKNLGIKILSLMLYLLNLSYQWDIQMERVLVVE